MSRLCVGNRVGKQAGIQLIKAAIFTPPGSMILEQCGNSMKYAGLSILSSCESGFNDSSPNRPSSLHRGRPVLYSEQRIRSIRLSLRKLLDTP